MNADFQDAHHRHLRDADSLFSASRLANADHLYGVAAECGLKRLMIAFGMRIRASDGAPDNKGDRVHVDELWKRYETYRSGHLQGAQYCLPLSSLFDDWNVSQRYEQTKRFYYARVEPHQAAAHTVHSLIKNAEVAGLI